jgi:antitoxin component YwqK of YwqJK toxin-antitoxin module
MHVYKSAKNNNKNVVITLFIGENSRSNLFRYYICNREYAKYRCDKAYVVKIEDDYENEYDYAEFICEKTNKLTKYIKNKYTIAEVYDENNENVNGKGITFFLNKDLARNYKRKLGEQIWGNIQNLYQTYFNDGTLKERIYFIYSTNAFNINDIYYQSIEEWYENTNKKIEKKYILNNYTVTEWYENGIIKVKYILVDNKIDGIYTEWYVNGNLKTIKQYNNGLLNGTCSEWYINGYKKLETEYDNDKIIEKYKKIYKNNQEILLTRSIKLSSLTNIYNNNKTIIPSMIPINSIKNNLVKLNTVNLYDKYNNKDNIIDEIKQKKELIKTNQVHFNVRNSISNRLELKLNDNKYKVIN